MTGVFCECGIQVPEHRLNQSTEIIRLRAEVERLHGQRRTPELAGVLEDRDEAQSKVAELEAEARSLRDRLKAALLVESPETPPNKPSRTDMGRAMEVLVKHGITDRKFMKDLYRAVDAMQWDAHRNGIEEAAVELDRLGYDRVPNLADRIRSLGTVGMNCWACNREAEGKTTTVKHVCVRPPDCDCGSEAKPGWTARHGKKRTGCLHTKVQGPQFDYSNGHPVSEGRELCMCSISDPPCVAADGTLLDYSTPGAPPDPGSCPECGGDPIPGRPYLCNCTAWGTDE